jgi:lipoprotein-releasing system ATP-binding protein
MNEASAIAPALSLKGLVRTFKSGEAELHVLNGIDLDIMPGEIVGLVGPSGSGKSSLLHAAGMLERPTDGEVRITGASGWTLSEEARTEIRRHQIGFVYQFHHLLPEFDAIHNAAVPALIAGRPRRETMAEAERLLTSLGLGNRLHHQPAQLSGGEQQRVALARALVNEPALILADEPTGNLDDALAQDILALLYEVNVDGTTVLIATHDRKLVASAPGRVLTLDHGRLRSS